MLDFTNQKFGKLLAVRPTDQRKNGHVVWECQCDCGNITFAASVDLARGKCISCGCIKREKAASVTARLENERIGKKFGRLTVLRVAEARKNGRRMLECRCDCGKIISVTETELKYGYRKSCGCIQKERNDQFRKTHPEIVPGQRYGRLTTLSLSDKRINHARTWECKCDCGNIVLAGAYQLSRGLKKSCGCLKKHQSLPVDTIGREDAP